MNIIIKNILRSVGVALIGGSFLRALSVEWFMFTTGLIFVLIVINEGE